MENKNKLLYKHIKEHKTIIIAKHVNPDWDAQGSASGIFNIIKDNFSDKEIYIAGSGIDNIINDDEKISKIDLSQALLITVDTANLERLDFKMVDKVKTIFKIDHHIEVEQYSGENKLIVADAIACTQVITLWANSLDLKISNESGYFLYKGLITDSGRFLYNNTSPDTFKAASILIEAGVSIQKVYDELYLQDLDLVKFKWSKFNKAKYNKNNTIAYILLKDKELLKYGDERAKFCLNTMASIRQIKIWFLVNKDKKNNCYKVSIRSRDYDINSVAIKHNGGGHRLASGCKIKSKKDIKKLIIELENLF